MGEVLCSRVMFDVESQPAPDFTQQLRMLRMLWLGIVACGFVYAVVVGMLNAGGMSAQNQSIVVSAMVAVSVGVALASFAARSILLRPARLVHYISPGGKQQFGHALILAHTVQWAMADASAGAGLLVFMLGAPLGVAYGLIAFSTAVLLVQAPSATTISNALAAAQQARIRMGLDAE